MSSYGLPEERKTKHGVNKYVLGLDAGQPLSKMATHTSREYVYERLPRLAPSDNDTYCLYITCKGILPNSQLLDYRLRRQKQ